MTKRTIALLTTMLLALGMTGVAAMASTTMLAPFTQEELDENWIKDRVFPTGGVESVSFDGRDNVAAITSSAEEAADESWWQFEGIKKVDDFGLAVQVDLYVPAEWQDTAAVNAGFWASDDPITAYPIIVYRNSDTVEAGFYTWDGVGGYDKTDIDANYDSWNTLSITLDTDANEASYAINGEDVGSIAADSDTIGQVFLNQFNFGVNSQDFTSHWHAGVTEIDEKDQCKDGSWEEGGFRNQGQCIRFVNTGQDSR